MQLRLIRRALLASCVLVMLGARAQGAQDTALDTYLADLTTWSAAFTQDVRDANGKVVDTDRGRLTIVRPGKFRLESSLDESGTAAALMVADGRNLWTHDLDLDQATVRALDESLSQSPAMLLAGSASLRASFDVSADGRRDGLDWVKVKPKQSQSDFREAQFGFRNRELSRIVIFDKLGQRSTLSFTGVRRNVPVDPKLTEFVLPEGVDLIGKPVGP
ncbi:MAG TPA: outer membrane lipoprotein chaperone LolA [Steroidobacteraceae bacterium]|nr:outer membrane lipoprotein chaperone LolA [Steroidobacteraceae bacterium]